MLNNFLVRMCLAKGTLWLICGLPNLCLYMSIHINEHGRGWVDDLSFFDYLSPYCYLLIEFHCNFSLSYKILQYYVYYYCILITM